MDDFTAGGKFDHFADVYDRWLASYERECVETLSGIAAHGTALELGVCTGRVAIPLARTGCRVSGIDISTRMLERLRAKEGANLLSLFVGDFVDIPLDNLFDLIYVLYTTLCYIHTQVEQIRCVRTVRERLNEHGAFVVETIVPGDWIFRNDWHLMTTDVTSESIVQTYARTDSALQLVQLQHLEVREGETKLYPQQWRFIWPTELDLLASLAGMTLDQRWGT